MRGVCFRAVCSRSVYALYLPHVPEATVAVSNLCAFYSFLGLPSRVLLLSSHQLVSMLSTAKGTMASAAAANDSAGCHRVEERDAIAVEHGSNGKTIATGGGGGGGGDDSDVRDMPPWEQHGGVINMPRYLYGANAALLQGSHPGFLITCAYRKHFMRFTHSVVSLSLFLFSGVPKVFVADFFDRSALW